MTRVGIIGASGYTGIELIRILLQHRQVHLTAISSRTYAAKRLDDVFPQFIGQSELVFCERMTEELDVVFFAAPNGVAMEQAPAWIEQGVKVIDLSADFRLPTASLWQTWYGQEHQSPHLLSQAVYGLTEVYASEIAKAQLVANPGCYPTSSLLGLYPLLKQGALGEEAIIIDAKSGVSGAGRRAELGLLFGEIQESFKPYKATAHRHWPEIQTQLQRWSETPFSLSFTPHLLPMGRGILASIYVTTTLPQSALQELYEETYQASAFVHVRAALQHPETRHVRNTNHVHLAVHKPEAGDIAKIFVVIDNLVKGAAGQAVQNMNLMCGFDEAEGLQTSAPCP